MLLKMWSTNSDGVVLEEDQAEFTSRAAASAFLAVNLTETASDEFLHFALAEWFTTGKISNLSEGNTSFWNVEMSGE